MGIVVLIWMLQFMPACPAQGVVSSPYGWRVHPISGRRSFHEGIDVANVEGTEVRTPWEGTVRKIHRNRSYGRHVVIDSGSLRVTLAHLSEVEVVKGQRLEKGDLVGLMGHTGRVTGDHLHLEVRHDGKVRNPVFALTSCGVVP
jgi:murein DD-endopeptidase MepM/ murein hydrolase activator NlpD